MQKNEVIPSFWEHIKENDKRLVRIKNKRDFLGQYVYNIRAAFSEYLEQLRSSGQITDEIANNISLISKLPQHDNSQS